MLIFHQLFPGSEIAKIAEQAGIDIQSVNLTSKNFLDLRAAIEEAYNTPAISTALDQRLQELRQQEEGNIYHNLKQRYPDQDQEEKIRDLSERIIEYRARTSENIIGLIVANRAIAFPSIAPAQQTPAQRKRDNMLKLQNHLLGNYAAQIIDIGLRSGLLRAIADAGGAIGDDTLAEKLGYALIYVQWWCKAAYAFELLNRDGQGQYTLAPDMQSLLLEPDDLDFLGDEFLLNTALFQEFQDFPSYLYTGQIRSRSEVDPRVRKFYQNLTQDDAFIITHLVLPQAPGVLDQLQNGESKILDIGTGAGDALVHYATCFPRAKIVGLDIDPPTVLLAQRKIAQEGRAYADRIEVRLGDANQLELRDEAPYDLITISLALHEIGVEYRNVLERVYQAIKPGGAVVVCEFYAAEGVAAYRNPTYQQWLSLHLHEILLGSIMIPSGEMPTLLVQAGFNLDRVRAIDHPINGYLMVLAEKEK
jgi:SAM-dependent methyltransferase